MAGQLAHLSRATFARLLAAEAVPTGVARLVYLDADLLLRRSIGPLFEVDLQGCALAACVDLNTPTVGQGLHARDRVDVDPRSSYFNAGVLVIDVDMWKREQLTERALRVIQQHEGHLPLGDQDVLNILLHECWHRLPAEWNLLWGGWGRRPDPARVTGTPLDEFEHARRDPAIVHFAGSLKPWHPRYGGRLSSTWFAEWQRVARRTPFTAQLLGGRRQQVERALWSPLVRPVDAGFRLVRRRRHRS
jgi:lipopolysaccharide biosynthesis glycosyltransferase